MRAHTHPHPHTQHQTAHDRCFAGASILFDLLMHQHGHGNALNINGFDEAVDTFSDSDVSMVGIVHCRFFFLYPI